MTQDAVLDIDETPSLPADFDPKSEAKYPITCQYPQGTNLPPVTRPSQLTAPQKRQLIFNALKAQGLNPYQISQVLEVSHRAAYRYNKKSTDELFSPLITPARKALKAVLQGKTIGNSEPPKASDLVNASKVVFDRTHPAKQVIESKSVRIDMSAEDYHRLMTSLTQDNGTTKVLIDSPIEQESIGESKG